MNKALYLKELKRNRKNALIWGSIVLGFTLMILSIYPSFAEMGEQMALLMSKMPQEMARAFGIDDETWSSIIGFYATYYGIYITLLMGIFTSSTGATILGKEERDGTAEFLLTRPISRASIVDSKYAALLTLLLLIYVIQTLCAVGGILAFGTAVDWDVFTAMHVARDCARGFLYCNLRIVSIVCFSQGEFHGPRCRTHFRILLFRCDI